MSIKQHRHIFFTLLAPFNAGVIASTLGKILQLQAVVLLPPLAVALIMGEVSYCALFAGCAMAGWLSGVTLVRLFPDQPDLEPREALLIAALAYFVFSCFGAVIFLPVAPFIDGFFEAMSGFTTTGLSMINPEQLPSSLLFFRSYSQWLGGIGIIILSLLIIIGPGSSAWNLYSTTYSQETSLVSMTQTVRFVMAIYLGLTLLGFTLFLVAGVPAFEGIMQVMSTLSTGGFSPYKNSMAGFSQKEWMLPITMLVMLMGATSHDLLLSIWYRKTNPLRDPQFLCFVALIVAVVVLWIMQPYSSGRILDGAFHAVSSITTTGFSLSEPGSWNDRSKLLSIFSMNIGGMSHSTAGGIKVLRLILLLKIGVWLFRHMILPEKVIQPLKLGDKVVTDSECKILFGFFAFYAIILLLSTLIFTLYNVSLINALFESTSALGTVGLSCGITTASLPLLLKGVLIFDMWAGRLEILPVLLALYPGTWWSLRRRQ